MLSFPLNDESIHVLANSYFAVTPHITGSEKHCEERAVLFTVRVHVIVSLIVFNRVQIDIMTKPLKHLSYA